MSRERLDLSLHSPVSLCLPLALSKYTPRKRRNLPLSCTSFFPVPRMHDLFIVFHRYIWLRYFYVRVIRKRAGHWMYIDIYVCGYEIYTSGPVHVCESTPADNGFVCDRVWAFKSNSDARMENLVTLQLQDRRRAAF